MKREDKEKGTAKRKQDETGTQTAMKRFALKRPDEKGKSQQETGRVTNTDCKEEIRFELKRRRKKEEPGGNRKRREHRLQGRDSP